MARGATVERSETGERQMQAPPATAKRWEKTVFHLKNHNQTIFETKSGFFRFDPRPPQRAGHLFAAGFPVCEKHAPFRRGRIAGHPRGLSGPQAHPCCPKLCGYATGTNSTVGGGVPDAPPTLPRHPGSAMAANALNQNFLQNNPPAADRLPGGVVFAGEGTLRSYGYLMVILALLWRPARP